MNKEHKKNKSMNVCQNVLKFAVDACSKHRGYYTRVIQVCCQEIETGFDFYKWCRWEFKKIAESCSRVESIKWIGKYKPHDAIADYELKIYGETIHIDFCVNLSKKKTCLHGIAYKTPHSRNNLKFLDEKEI